VVVQVVAEARRDQVLFLEAFRVVLALREAVLLEAAAACLYRRLQRRQADGAQDRNLAAQLGVK
jgi:hypothetical protein